MPTAELVEAVDAEAEVERDADRLCGIILDGGKILVTHAAIADDEGGIFFYCRPERKAEGVDFSLAPLVTCSMCKEKLKTELTVRKRGGPPGV